MSALKDAMDAWPLPDGEPFVGETLRADGWVYRDLPRMAPNAMKTFLGIVGEREIRWLTHATYGDGSERGQLFISPKGMENLTAWTRRCPDNGSPQ